MPYHLEFRDPPRMPQFVMPIEVGTSGLTKAQAASPRWRRTARALYVPSGVDSTQPAQRVVEAAGRLSPGGALTGWAVMLLAGGRFFDGWARGGPLPVRLQMGPHQGRRKRPGIQWCYDHLVERDEILGLPCTPAPWAVFDEMRSGDLRHAVVTLDMAVRNRFVTLDQMQAFVEERVGTTGVLLLREALTLADPHSGSPPETELRLVWQRELGLPRPLVNVAVFGAGGRLLGYPDLFDDAVGLAVEYDGEHHREARQHSDDVDREAAFRDAGLEVTRVTSLDTGDRVGLGRRLLRARARAHARTIRRGWSLEP